MNIGVIQLNVSDNPEANLDQTKALIKGAALAGAKIIFTPEVTNGIIVSEDRRAAQMRTESEDETLSAIQAQARELGVWINIGSLALRDDQSDKLVNRSFMIDPTGQITARYDKIHMFDAQISASEGYRESAFYRAGDRAVLCQADDLSIGLTICYDLRFPALYRDLAQEGAGLITVPSAFTVATGQAHWHSLLAARAIETGCFIVAASQTGEHMQHDAAPRQTFGHSVVYNPWGELLLDMGQNVGFRVLELDLSEVERARRRIPSLHHDQDYKGP